MGRTCRIKKILIFFKGRFIYLLRSSFLLWEKKISKRISIRKQSSFVLHAKNILCTMWADAKQIFDVSFFFDPKILQKVQPSITSVFGQSFLKFILMEMFCGIYSLEKIK